MLLRMRAGVLTLSRFIGASIARRGGILYSFLMVSESLLLSRLKQKGYRLTVGRKAIAKLIAGNLKPFSAAELHGMLKKKGQAVDKVSVYRELSVLAKEGIVRSVNFNDGIQRYELADTDHHHHLVCLKCNAIEDVHMDHDLDGMEKKIAKEKKFKVLEHSLEFYGVCRKCG